MGGIIYQRYNIRGWYNIRNDKLKWYNIPLGIIYKSGIIYGAGICWDWYNIQNYTDGNYTRCNQRI